MKSTLVAFLLLPFTLLANTSTFPLKKHSAFYPPERLAQIQASARQKNSWTAKLRDEVVTAAQQWMDLSDDELWELMFGPTISRSWMVWSNGHCPSCKKPVEMYRWKMEALKHPWKTRCPECEELFPKNDFYAFYRSGLNEHGIFDPKKADRKLLFNSEHPDPIDPLHKFGVDDGEGYVEGNNRWRFISSYLIFGQFRQRIFKGIMNLSGAYVLTGDKRYAHKAAVLLDRVADVYPSFDYAKQGFVYETQGHNGYITVWHDTCEETYEMALAYDQVFEALSGDTELFQFLASKAEKFRLPNPKRTFEDVQRNIEGGLIRDPLAHPEKIHSNFPRRECTTAALHTVLGWPENREAVEKMIDAFVKPATAVDGITGEKGLSGYSAYTIAAMTRFLGEYVRSDPEFLPALLKRNPALRNTYRFHIDTHCLDQYYPNSGDTGGYGRPSPNYALMPFKTFFAGFGSPLTASMYSFMWQFYLETNDPAYVQVLYRQNNNSVKDLPYEVFEGDPKKVQREISKVIARHGPNPTLGNVDKKQWHIAILRSGKKEDARALWLDYDSGGAHGHHDGMNLGLFAHGLDLLPDFGYPPVQFGGWQTPRAQWYLKSAAHNTVVVDGRDHANGAGQTTLWADGKHFNAIRVSAPGLAPAKQFERTICLADVSDEDFYVVDIFRVVGGTDHAKFTHALTGPIQTEGLDFKETVEYGHGTQTRKFRRDPQPRPGWNISWTFEDRLKVLPPKKEVRMRYTDLTAGAQGLVGEAWIVLTGYNAKTEEIWNPCIVSRRQGTAPLVSTFISVIEPFEKKNTIAQIRRLPLYDGENKAFGDSHVALEIMLQNGGRDLLIAADVENPQKTEPLFLPDRVLIQPDWNVRLEGELCWVRKNGKGKIERVALGKARTARIGDRMFEAKNDAEFTELNAN